MAVETYNYEDAPKEYQQTSSFRNDERCYGVDLVAGENYDVVYEATRKLFRDKECVDFDVNFDTVSGLWVGITCRDYADDV